MKAVFHATDAKAFDQTLADLRRTLGYLAASGIHGFDARPATVDTLEGWAESEAAPRSLTQIRQAMGACHACELWRTRGNIVFGEGAATARLVFIGEGPGFEEDRQGRPFVGPAGKLLTKIIAAMQLSREAVYICNIVKCRPPGNRNPSSEEIRRCLPFLEQQLLAIQPEFICALGSIAAQALLNTTQPISRLRGRLHPFRGARLMPTYHPAYLLRNPDKKRDVWQDVKQLMHAMGLS